MDNSPPTGSNVALRGTPDSPFRGFLRHLTTTRDGWRQRYGTAPSLGTLAGVAGFAWLFQLSSHPRAVSVLYPSVLLPRTAFVDTAYTFLDPFLMYLVLGSLVFTLLFWPNDHKFSPTQLVRTLTVAVAFLALLTLALFPIENWLKEGLGRARPVARIEHYLLAEHFEGELSSEQQGMLRGAYFECPIGRILFGTLPLPKERSQWPAFVESELVRTGMSSAEASEHIHWIRDRIGIGPYDVSIEEKFATHEVMSRWRQKNKEPFLVALLNERKICDVRGAAPSGHILRQGFVLLASMAFVVLKRRRVPFVARRCWIGWVLIGTNLVVLTFAGWSRVYGFDHTWSDELISVAVTGSLFLALNAAVFVGLRIAPAAIIEQLDRGEAARLLGAAGLMLAFFDRHRITAVWNTECVRVTGMTKSDVQTYDSFVRRFYQSPLHEHTMNRFLGRVEGESAVRSEFIEFIGVDGQSKLVRWMSLSVHGGRHEPIGQLSVGIEVSRVKMRLADVGYCSSALLHEVRKRMRVLLRSVERGEGLERVADVARDMNQLCDSIRDYVGGGVGRHADVDMMKVVDFAYAVVVDEAGLDGISVTKELDREHRTILGSDVLLQQAAIGMLRNGIDAVERRMAREPTAAASVKISLKVAHDNAGGEGEGVLLEVRDTGCGMPTDVRRWIEEGTTFGELRDTDADMGLGLAIARLVARDHGGRLYYRANIESGTTVGIFLPYPARIEARRGNFDSKGA